MEELRQYRAYIKRCHLFLSRIIRNIPTLLPLVDSHLTYIYKAGLLILC